MSRRTAATICSTPGCPQPAEHRGRCRAHGGRPWHGSHERRVTLGVLDGRAGIALRRAVRMRARHRCESCGELVPDGAGVVDHRVPVAAGGRPSDLSNLWLLCDECDAAKTRDDLDAMRSSTVAPSPSPHRAGTPAGSTRRGAHASGVRA